jgi:hypothetical protein
MAVGGVYVARRHKAATLDGAAAATLRPQTENAAIDALVAWDSVARLAQPVGSSVTLDSSAERGVWVTRTTDDQYLIVAQSLSRTAPAFHHRIGLSVVISAGRPRLPFPRVWSLLP